MTFKEFPEPPTNPININPTDVEDDRVTLPTPAIVTVSIDLRDLLAASGYVPAGEDDHGEYYAEPLQQSITTQAAERVAANVMTSEFALALRGQIGARVEQALADALTAGVQPMDNYGNSKGPKVALRQLLAEATANQVAAWMKGGAGLFDGYGKTPFQKMLADEVNRTVTADLKGLLAQARKEINAAVQKIAAEQVAAAKAALKKDFG